MPTSSLDAFIGRVVAHRNTREVVGAVAAIAVAWLVGKNIAGGRVGFVGMLLGFLVFFFTYFRPHSFVFVLPIALSMPNLGLDIPGPWAVTSQEAFIGLGLSAYVTRAILHRQYVIPRDDRIIGPLWMFVGIAILCIYKVAQLNPNMLVFNMKELIRLAMLSFLYVTMVDVLDSKKQIMRYTYWVLVWGVWMMGVSIYSYLTLSPFWYGILTMQPAYIYMRHKILRMISIAGSTSYTGIYYATVLALAAQFAPFFTPKARRVWAAVYLAAMGACIFLTFNRGTWVGMLLGLAALLLQGQINRRRAAGAALLIAGVLVLMTTSLFVQVDVGQRAVDFVHYSRASAESRVVRWVSAVNAILDQPLLGVGFNNYAFLYGRYSIVEGVNRQLYGSPHNMFVDIITGTGIIGFLVFMTVIVRLYLMLRDNMNAALPPDLKLLSRGIFLAYIFFLGSGLFDSFLFKVHHSSYLIVSTWAMGAAIRRLRLGLVRDPEMTEFLAPPAAPPAEAKQ